MTVEELHDALTLLPAELVAEADKRRSRKVVRIQWRRWAGMAACLVVILGCSFWLWVSGMRMGSSKSSQMIMAAPAAYDEAAAENAPQKAMPTQASANEEMAVGSGVTARDSGTIASGIGNIIWVETPGDSNSTANVSGAPDVTLATDRAQLEGYLKDQAFENVDELRESTNGYDEAWFASHDLLLIRLMCASDTTVEAVQEGKGQWEVTLNPSPISLLRCYHILIETEKGTMENADRVTVTYGESEGSVTP